MGTGVAGYSRENCRWIGVLMSFHWSEYLTLAQELTSTASNSPIQEADLRSAISRAYYAAFGQARAYLVEIEKVVIPYGTNVHWFVVDNFESSDESIRRTVGHLLHHLRSTRNIADYENVFYRDVRGVARAALSESEEVIRLLKTL